ncbi:MAG: class I SAM-dependent rRNA methyltransferase [Acidobacteria bacterium]|nr:MAG: class I SAM-dependent rRNA methyltransferase [Acidobacteriota bacterium]
MPQATVTVSPRGIERIFAGHPWIYRSDVSASANIEPGSVVSIQDRRKRFLGQALYSNKSQIALRFLTREKHAIDRAFLAGRIQAAADYRGQVVKESEAFRLVASEGDLLPSLVIDRYGEYLVVQTLSQGMEKLKPIIIEILQEQFAPRGIVERNDVAVRALEALEQAKGTLAGEVPEEVIVSVNGLRFAFNLLEGQKTGGFLDQRENQRAAQSYAFGRALDCFTYSGGFALNISHCCSSVLAIDSSQEALRLAQRNAELNGVSNIEWKEANCFDFLKAADQAGERFDVVVLDPPAFARQRSNLDSALRGYKELNLRGLKILNPGGYLITCSCSYHVTEADFLEAIASAAVDAHRTVTVVERRTQGRDHPILLTVPETHYLKCLILRAL